jgi:hypothetical protein
MNSLFLENLLESNPPPPRILVYNEKTCGEGRFNFVRRKLSILLYSIKKNRDDRKLRLYTLNAVWYSSIIQYLAWEVRKLEKRLNIWIPYSTNSVECCTYWKSKFANIYLHLNWFRNLNFESVSSLWGIIFNK